MIEIERIAPSEYGWPVMMHCSKCRVTTIIHHPYGLKPEDGDYYRLEMCIDEPFHNFEYPIRKYLRIMSANETD